MDGPSRTRPRRPKYGEEDVVAGHRLNEFGDARLRVGLRVVGGQGREIPVAVACQLIEAERLLRPGGDDEAAPGPVVNEECLTVGATANSEFNQTWTGGSGSVGAGPVGPVTASQMGKKSGFNMVPPRGRLCRD
jgi:hypothetical protein